MRITAPRQPTSTSQVARPLRMAVSGLTRLRWLVAFAQQTSGRVDRAAGAPADPKPGFLSVGCAAPPRGQWTARGPCGGDVHGRSALATPGP